MNTYIKYKNREDGFHHKTCDVLYDIDIITSLHDCPFPLETDTFKVIHFGVTKDGAGRDCKFAVVEYTKSCGNTVIERIPFIEGVKDFTSYGEDYKGSDYSTSNWEKRIEFFRTNLPCDVVQRVNHSIWIYEIGESEKGNSRKKLLDGIIYLLDYNYENWKEFISMKQIEDMVATAKYNSK